MTVGIQSGRLGDRLRHARESRGASTEKASEQASIPIRYIQMFEEGRYPLVADPAYLTHFVRRYAAYLGLDVWQASRDFIAETEPEKALRPTGTLARQSAGVERALAPNDKRSRFEPGPLALVAAIVTLSLFLLHALLHRTPHTTLVEPEASSATATAPRAAAPPPAPSSAAQSALPLQPPATDGSTRAMPAPGDPQPAAAPGDLSRAPTQ